MEPQTMPNLVYQELNNDTDIVLGRRGGILGNACYQMAIRRWAPHYASAKNSFTKKQIVSQIYSSLKDRGIRFLVLVGAGPGGVNGRYALVTEDHPAMQRIQRSLQEYTRRQSKADQMSSASSVSTSTADGELESGESIGEEDLSCSTYYARFRLVPGNETRSGTPLPMLLERKSSAFTISDASIEDLLNEDLLRQMSGYQPTGAGGAEAEDRPPTNAATAPRLARSWPEIHLRHKSFDAVDTVSLITECSTSPETPRRSSTDESTVGPRSARFLPNVTSKGQKPASQGDYRLLSRETHQQYRMERMMLNLHAEVQALRTRVAAMEERETIREEQLRRLQHEQEPQASDGGWSAVG